MNGIADVLNWSLPLIRMRAFEVRISWLLLVWMLFDAIRFSQMHLGMLIPFAFVVPPLAMLIHAAGHMLGTRLAGGVMSNTILSCLNNQDVLQAPLRPWSHFLAGIGGPLANLIALGTCWAAQIAMGDFPTLHPFAFPMPGPLIPALLVYAATVNLLVLLLNLLACSPFDGHRWWRGLLWMFTPMPRAVRAATILGFISAILLLVVAAWFTSFLMLFIAITSLLMTIQDRQQIANGYDPVFQVDPHYGGAAPSSGWAKRRAETRQERLAQEEADEQEVLDRLLEKVSANGLPSLTAAERKQLQRISRRQKERAAGG